MPKSGLRVLIPDVAAIAFIACVTLAQLQPAVAGRDGRGATEAVGKNRSDAAERWVLPHSALPEHALVYAERSRGPEVALEGVAWNVFWLPGPGGKGEHRIYAGSRTLQGILPVDLGFLPSPDGRWVLVWETLYSGDGLGTEPVKTVWTAVELPSGRKLQVGSQPGLVGYLPYWSDGRTLVLEQGTTVLTFDMTTGRLSPPLPKRRGEPGQWRERTIDHASEDERAADWHTQYLQRHFHEAWKALLQAQRSFPDQLGIAEYLKAGLDLGPDTTANVLLRPMGIVGLGGYMSRKTVWPSVAVSPDGRFIARAAVVRVGEVTGPMGTGKRMGANHTCEARLDVYELSTGRRMWGLALPWQTAVVDDDDVVMALSHVQGESWFGDVRWSGDNRYVSFTWHQARRDSVSVVDAFEWKEALRLSNASNAFVIPSVAGNER